MDKEYLGFKELVITGEGAVAKYMINHLWSNSSIFMPKNRKRTPKSPQSMV